LANLKRKGLVDDDANGVHLTAVGTEQTEDLWAIAQAQQEKVFQIRRDADRNVQNCVETTDQQMLTASQNTFDLWRQKIKIRCLSWHQIFFCVTLGRWN
jgi:hypothetical protein